MIALVFSIAVAFLVIEAFLMLWRTLRGVKR